MLVIVYSTHLGGTGGDEGRDIAVDAAGNVTGRTTSTDFPTVNPLQPAHGGGGFPDAFIAKTPVYQADLLMKKESEHDSAFAINEVYQTVPAGDGQTDSDPDVVNITIRNNINEPPVADAGFAQVGRCTVNIDISGSNCERD